MVVSNLVNGMVVGTSIGALTGLISKRNIDQLVNGIALTLLGVLGGSFLGLDPLESAKFIFTTLGTVTILKATVFGDSLDQRVSEEISHDYSEEFRAKINKIFDPEVDILAQVNKIEFLLTKLGIFGLISSCLGRNAGMMYLTQSVVNLGVDKTNTGIGILMENLQDKLLPMVTGSILTCLAIATITTASLPLKVYGVVVGVFLYNSRTYASLGLLILSLVKIILSYCKLFPSIQSDLKKIINTEDEIRIFLILWGLMGGVLGGMLASAGSKQLGHMNITPIIGSVLSAVMFPAFLKLASELPTYTSSCFTKGIEGDNNWEKIKNYFSYFSDYNGVWSNNSDRTDQQILISKIVKIAMAIGLIILTRNSLKSFIRQSV